METTMEELTSRLEKLAGEVQSIRRSHGGHLASRPRGPLTAAEWGAIAMEEAQRNAELNSQILAQALTEMGIVGEPVSHDELFRLYEEAGFDSEC